MKVRTGFVSNSSSSSFVLLGVKVDRIEDEELYEWLREGHDCWCCHGDGPYYVGMTIASFCDEGISEIEGLDMDDAMVKTRAFLKKHKLPSNKIKIYAGTEMSYADSLVQSCYRSFQVR